MNIAQAYKAGDVESGNWAWAVGVRDDAGRMMHVATINLHACHALGLDHETVAIALARGFTENVS